MKKSKNVTSWFITVTPDGVYQILFNTVEKWMPFHAYNDTQFIIGEEVEGETHEEWLSKIQNVPEFLPEIKDGFYIQSVLQNKDQISVFFRPYYRDWVKEGKDKVIFKSEDYEQENLSM